MGGVAWTASDSGNSGGYVASALMSETDEMASVSAVVVVTMGGDMVARAMIVGSGSSVN